MSRALLILADQADRDKAKHWIDNVPVNSRVEFKRPQRSLDQNSKMWACLTDMAEQLRWHGLRLAPDDWKLIFLDALRRQKNEDLRIVPNVDGNGFVSLGKSSSDLSTDEMSDLIELVLKFGAEHDVKFHEPGAHSSRAPAEDGAGVSPPPSPAPSSSASNSYALAKGGR